VADHRVDHAVGLRRLLGGGQHLLFVTFVSGCEGVGRSVSVANLCVALACLGKEVLIIDEHASRDDIASSFGLMARYDLLNVVQRELSLAQVLLQPMQGLRVLPAAKAAKKLGRLSLAQQQTLLDAMCGLDRPIDVILVDASMAHPNGFSPFGLASQEAVVVLSGSSASITEAYALMKRLSHAFSRKNFRSLVDRVRVRGEVGRFMKISPRWRLSVALRALSTRAPFRLTSRCGNPHNWVVRSCCRRRILLQPRLSGISPRICSIGREAPARPVASNISCSNCYT